MVQYEPRGLAGRHDHPYEETYLILDEEVDAEFDGERYHLVPGDIAWAGVGCVHAFTNPGPGIVRWLETQAPQPPHRHSYRFAGTGSTWPTPSRRKGRMRMDEHMVLVVGGTHGLGWDLARHYAASGRRVA